MKLHKLTATNFMPYRGVNSVDFPQDESRNVMLIVGDNMRGKTSLLNALRWGFYGQAVGRHARVIPLQEIVNKNAADEDDWRVDVLITFEANGHDYELRRSAEKRPHVATPSRTEDFIVSSFLKRDGVVLPGDQFEPEINQIAPEQTSRFFLFDGELLSQYEELLIEGSEQGRQIKEAIEQVLGVPSLINGRNEMGSILKQSTKRQSQEMAHMAGLQQQAEQTDRLTTRLDSFEDDLKKLLSRRDITRSERAQLEDELDAAAVVLALKAQMDAARATLKAQQDTIARKRVERQTLLSEAWKDLLDGKLEVKRSLLRDRQQSLTGLVGGRARLQGRVEDIRKLLATEHCPTCQQALSSEKKTGLGTALGSLEVELSKQADTTSELQDIAGQLAGLEKIRGVRARARIVETDRDLRSAEVTAQKAENDIERLVDEIAGHDTADLARKRVLKDEKLKEEGRLTADIENVKISIQRTKDDLAIAQRAIQGFASARTNKSTMKVKLASELERCFNASVEKLRDRLRERVELLASGAFLKMTTQKAYRGLEINGNYGLSIIDSHGRKVSLRSAGAEQVVALSLIDGLNRTGRAVGPILMDTPFGRLDLYHRDNILKYLPSVASQFVLLVHGGEIRLDTDLASIKSKIGAVYEIREISETESKLERTAL
ncbi:AAA family ATPase [Bosea sp. (in: a-proteobacteria)]|uniref:AAA family ATPase n=1 Tax=Bosea sp. (in: a-proteobacteria) TaxID=1871050 RepID=UPI002733FC6F|nr:AAA family ATPase [Bosea sp. (in: a-proteobacteria)]MDP3410804.1 AAA family ATPase [Bosea sp. (in: a-proteobacteria)]